MMRDGSSTGSGARWWQTAMAARRFATGENRTITSNRRGGGSLPRLHGTSGAPSPRTGPRTYPGQRDRGRIVSSSRAVRPRFDFTVAARVQP